MQTSIPNLYQTFLYSSRLIEIQLTREDFLDRILSFSRFHSHLLGTLESDCVLVFERAAQLICRLNHNR